MFKLIKKLFQSMNQSMELTMDEIELDLAQAPTKRAIMTAQKTAQLIELQNKLTVLEAELAAKQAKRNLV